MRTRLCLKRRSRARVFLALALLAPSRRAPRRSPIGLGHATERRGRRRRHRVHRLQRRRDRQRRRTSAGCRAARRRVTSRSTLPTPVGTGTVSRPVVHRRPARASRSLVHRYGQQTALFLCTSTDGGATFSAPRSAAPTCRSSSRSPVRATPSRSSRRPTAAARCSRTCRSSWAARRAVRDALRCGRRAVYNGTVGLIDATTPLAIFADGDSIAALPALRAARRRQRRGELDRGGRHRLRRLPAARGRAARPVPARRRRGRRAVRAQVRRDDVRRARPADQRTAMPSETAPVPGRRRAAARRLSAATRSTATTRSTRSPTTASNWQSAQLAIQPSDEPGSMRVAAAADHVGVAVWVSGVGASRSSVAAIGAGAPTQPPPPARTARAGAHARRAGTRMPEFHKTVVVRPISGKVRVRLHGSRRFVDLTPSTTSRSARRSTSSRAGSSSPRCRRAAARSRRCSSTAAGSASRSPARSPSFTLNEPLASCKQKARAAGRQEAEVAQAVGRRQGQVPHPRAVQRGDHPRHRGSCRTRARAR